MNPDATTATFALLMGAMFCLGAAVGLLVGAGIFLVGGG